MTHLCGCCRETIPDWAIRTASPSTPTKDVFYVANYGSHALRRADREIRTGVPGSGKGRDKANWPFGREYAVPGSGTQRRAVDLDPRDHGEGERQAAPRHQGIRRRS